MKSRTVPIAVALVGFPLAALALPRWFGPLAAAAIWGLGVVLCFSGWGGWVRRRLAPGLDVDWGLRAAWGMALTVVVGGPLCLLGLARRPILLAWIFAGVALAARDVGRAVAARPTQGRPAPRGWDAQVLAGLLGLVAFVYLGAATRGGPNPSDDWVAYLPFIHKLVQTGTLIEPFSVRRMASFGGQSYLQALISFGSDDAQIQLFDQGVCLVILVGLVLGVARPEGRTSRLIPFLLVLVMVMLPEVRINSASEVSGALGLLAAFRTVVVVERDGVRGWRGSLLVALPMAAVSTLRQPYMFVVGFMLLALLVPAAGESESDSAASRRRRFLEATALTGAGLLAWSALAFRSNHTFLFPLFSGNYDPSYAGITPASSWEPRLRFYLGALFHEEPIRVMPLLLLAAPAVARSANRRALLGLWLGTIVAFALIVLSLPEMDNFTIARYGFGSVVALALATGLAASEQIGDAAPRAEPVAVALVAAALAIQIHGTHSAAVRNLGGALGRIFAADRRPPPMATTAPEVLKMQATVPAGAALVVMIERPFLLDFARNPIALLDLPGAASPRRALPLMQGGEKVAAYLLAEGFRYLAFASPDRPQNDVYRRSHWKDLLVDSRPNARGAAPLYLAAFDDLDYLARTRHRLYDDGHFVVVDLAVRGG